MINFIHVIVYSSNVLNLLILYLLIITVYCYSNFDKKAFLGSIYTTLHYIRIKNRPSNSFRLFKKLFLEDLKN